MKSHDEKTYEETHDPDGVPTNNRQMKQNDQVTETSAGVEVTSPTPLSGKPAAYQVGQSDPGQPAAPLIAVEAPKSQRSNAIPEYRPSVSSRLPDTISARDVYNDDSNCDGRIAGRVQR
ncbi:MAG: hypothetical protein WBV60_11060 [Terriglobales bacterium]